MTPEFHDEISEFIRSQGKLLPFGGRSKTSLQAPEGVTPLGMSPFSGVLEYEPEEYTFTALAGTKLDEIAPMLKENGQFLPFDPPFLKRGGTLGGSVAAGLSGSARYRYGGVRDFLLGVQYFDCQGRLVRSGGKVVKNAAGFDIPKLMVGSLGSLGALVELNIKVFPQPLAYVTITSHYATLHEALETLVRLTTSPIEIYCLDLEPGSDGFSLQIRLGGVPSSFAKRIDRLRGEIVDHEVLEGDAEIEYWWNIREFMWLPEDSTLVKIPITPKQVPELDNFLREYGSVRRYSVGANLAWIAWSKPLEFLDHHLNEYKLSGLTILGSAKKKRLGNWKGGSFYKRIKQALDPVNKWAEV